jgi:hypothetical protein
VNRAYHEIHKKTRWASTRCRGRCIETEYSTIFFDVCHVRSDGSVGDLSVILLTTLRSLPDDVHRIADGSFCIAPPLQASVICAYTFCNKRGRQSLSPFLTPNTTLVYVSGCCTSLTTSYLRVHVRLAVNWLIRRTASTWSYRTTPSWRVPVRFLGKLADDLLVVLSVQHRVRRLNEYGLQHVRLGGEWWYLVITTIEINDSIVHFCLESYLLGRSARERDYDVHHEPEGKHDVMWDIRVIGTHTSVDSDIGTNGNGEDDGRNQSLHIYCSNGVITATRGYVDRGRNRDHDVLDRYTNFGQHGCWLYINFTGTVGAGPLDRTTVTRITASADAIAAGDILLLLRFATTVLVVEGGHTGFTSFPLRSSV